jgi:hypothetical protein
VAQGVGEPGSTSGQCFNGKQGTELADVIVNKIKQAVNAITYR